MQEITAIDLFCGAGGLSEGFQQAGFTILAGNDFDEHAGATFSVAHDAAEFLPGPIEEISADHLLEATGLEKGGLDCLIGGPPCQAFSVYNHQRGLLPFVTVGEAISDLRLAEPERQGDAVNIIFMPYSCENDPVSPGGKRFALSEVEGASHSSLQQAVL